MNNTVNHDDDRELYYKISGKVEIINDVCHRYRAESELETDIDGQRRLYQGCGNAKSSFKALEKAIKNAGYLAGIIR